MSSERNWSVFLRRLFLFCFCLLFVFLFLILWCCKFRNHDPWQVSVSKPSTSVSNQRNSSYPFEIQTLCSFYRVRLWDRFFVHGTTRHRQLLALSLQDFQKLPQKVGTENYSTWLMRNVCKNVSSRPTGLFCRFCWNESACPPDAYSSLPLPATTTQLFSQSLSSHTLCSCLEILSTNNNLCNLWHTKVQQNSTYAFCSWDDIFAKKYDCSSRNNLCKCTDSPSTLSTNTSIEWNIYFSWSNHLVTSFRLEMNVGSILERQIKTSDTDRYKRYFFTARVYQVNVNTMKRIFEQRSELQVAKCLIVHVLFSSYNVSRLELRNKRKATEQWSFCVANDILLNQVGVYLYVKRECMRTMSKENCGLWGPFPLNITPNSLPTLLPHSKECKTRSFLCKVKINFFAFFETL